MKKIIASIVLAVFAATYAWWWHVLAEEMRNIAHGTQVTNIHELAQEYPNLAFYVRIGDVDVFAPRDDLESDAINFAASLRRLSVINMSFGFAVAAFCSGIAATLGSIRVNDVFSHRRDRGHVESAD